MNKPCFIGLENILKQFKNAGIICDFMKYAILHVVYSTRRASICSMAKSKEFCKQSVPEVYHPVRSAT